MIELGRMEQNGIKHIQLRSCFSGPTHLVRIDHPKTALQTKKRTGPWLVVALILLLSYPPALLCRDGQINVDSFDAAYNAGKLYFYEILKQRASEVPLKMKEQRMLLDPQKKIPGLYEHLMNFYYFHNGLGSEQKVDYRTHLLNFSRNMAEEFILSIHEMSLYNASPSLKSLLSSTGYFSREMTPIHRKYRRPVGKKIKGQKVLEDLKVSEAHSLSRGHGIKLAIIDSGIDPTIEEIRQRIKKWKNFLDSSKPIIDKGEFPFDWGGHGTSIASVIFQVAPKVELIIIKVSDNETTGTVPPSRWNAYLFAAGMIWAAQNGADIINLSAAFIVDTKSIREATKFCWENNVVVVSPLANMKENMTKEILFFPAAYPWTIAVGGVEKTNAKFKISPLSSKAEYLDVVAPSSGIFVETPSYLDRIKQSKMASRNSVAVPFVAGTSALILSAMDSSTLKKLKAKPGQLVETVRTILRQSSSKRKLGLDKQTSDSGSGMIDILKAVQMARNYSL